MAEYTLSDFNQELAKNGVSVGYLDANDEVHVATEIDFYKVRNTSLYGRVWFDEDFYEFLYDGCFYIGTDKQYLKMVSTTITKTTGTKIARTTDSNGTTNARPVSSGSIALASNDLLATDDSTEEIFSIATLQPREEIAMHALESMIAKYDNPLNFDNTKIKQLVSKSFLFAQEFINQAVLYREKETTSSTVESNDYASVDSDSLSSDTDKLLFNISTALTNMMAQNRNQYADQQKNGLKVNTSNITVTSTFPDTINATVSGSVKAEVSGSVTTKQETASSAE